MRSTSGLAWLIQIVSELHLQVKGLILKAIEHIYYSLTDISDKDKYVINSIISSVTKSVTFVKEWMYAEFSRRHIDRRFTDLIST